MRSYLTSNNLYLIPLYIVNKFWASFELNSFLRFHIDNRLVLYPDVRKSLKQTIKSIQMKALK